MQNAIVWAAENTSPAVLHAYNAINLQELYNTNQAADSRDHFGAGNKFITPMIANGKVYVGTTTGVGVFGLSRNSRCGAGALAREMHAAAHVVSLRCDQEGRDLSRVGAPAQIGKGTTSVVPSKADDALGFSR